MVAATAAVSSAIIGFVSFKELAQKRRVSLVSTMAYQVNHGHTFGTSDVSSVGSTRSSGVVSSTAGPEGTAIAMAWPIMTMVTRIVFGFIIVHLL
jgi:hypothetical protein